MADPHFKIIFNGQLRNGVERETASLNLTELFKSDASIVEKLFSGRAATLKHGLSHEQALRYLEALHEAGVEAHIEVESPVSVTSDDTHQSPSYHPK